ncbi:hypothetical protein DFQ05_1451 [Winogradskyella wandonensis]|uniref:Peptidoglycan biosynthesis/recognition protein n=1 Tax=Winogradskyella wandonensis TaxID=1442586 RepID=A0A4R1KRP1_9FLAO|nr:hypothetical protein [Winogradskyella wandonensis]TCK67672.1 hypothetical protein DFQ05_1451 [Winogradskyella wandonensis]
MSLKTEIFNAVNKIPQSYWDNLKCCTNIYYSPEFLQAFEIANKDIIFNYIFITRNGEAIAFANTQLVSIGIETITKNIRINAWLKRHINRIFCKSSIKILFGGNIFLSGEYGTFLKEGEDKIKTFTYLAEGIQRLSKSLKKHNGLFLKDFKNESIYITKHLSKFDYTPMSVEPNMIINLKAEWQTFADYKSALKSKYRVKANKADTKSNVLVSKVFDADDIEIYKPQLQALYQNTIDNADFNAQVLDLNTYTYLKKSFSEAFTVIGYFKEKKLVGFLSAMKNGDNLDAHFIGLDYNKNKELAIYPRILNDYVRLGLSTNAKRINLGRTASEIKSTLGAQPEALTCYFKHKSALPNKVIRPFVKNIAIKTFKQHQPFK